MIAKNNTGVVLNQKNATDAVALAQLVACEVPQHSNKHILFYSF